MRERVESLLDRLHGFMARIGISPKVGDPVLLAAVGIASHWIATGEFDATELRFALGTALYAIVGFKAPPAKGLSLEEVAELAPDDDEG